ncbi:hypothetical protein AVEN_123658-1 [Araneus ventricosus]|uniref:Uncharacterized protein n=1 Tax=Araneus ventricosus TaxID=182803 RepID=A0A4Y2LMA5_ARAVE|nr:hypothetical protein AVEN_123658-1 [Araneus ventricosus]
MMPQGLFWNKPHHFEQRSTPNLATPSPSFRTIAEGWRFALTDLTCTSPTHTAILLWNRVSSLEPSSPEGETVPTGQSGPNILQESQKKVQPAIYRVPHFIFFQIGYRFLI